MLSYTKPAKFAQDSFVIWVQVISDCPSDVNRVPQDYGTAIHYSTWRAMRSHIIRGVLIIYQF